MIKTEQLKGTNQFKRLLPSASTVSSSLRTPMFQATSNTISQRSIDPHAIDISSIKGRFAWEKISLGDTYMPVIFRGTVKYFCVKMLQKLLYEYPDDVIRRSSFYQYKKPLDLHVATPNEIKLLNRINTHHSHWTYSRQLFTTVDELVRVSDFLPFYEYLRSVLKSTPIPRTTSASSLRQILPQPQLPVEQPPDFVVNMSNRVRGHSTGPATTASIQSQPSTALKIPRRSALSVPRPIPSAPSALRPARPPLYSVEQLPLHYSLAHVQQQLPPPPSQQPIARSSTNIIKSANTVPTNKLSTVPLASSVSQSSTSPTSVLAINSSSPDAVVSGSTTTNSHKLSIASSNTQLTPISKQSSSSSTAKATITPSPSVPKLPRLNSGWLQINKLYTPYISTSTANHHLFKIPVSLLTFYELLKTSSCENNPNESKDPSFAFEQTLVTPQEIELINELCLKQNIKPFSIDTKLIDLFTFYQHCSASILFVKELPLNEPKASICKDWSTIVQINGGICRLRNITTLHEQTVPFIGKNLLKNFIISAQCLVSASLTTPTTSEMEFLQLILFFSNMSINIGNAKLIDIESVQKEYNVDLILLFNDKFPLNVLNYQHQDNRSSTSQGQVIQSDSSAATNTFAESTPPPSPPSPAVNNLSVNSASHLPLMSSSSNRYQKTITFHGHSMTAYICSGFGSNAHRECISVKALCHMLYPNSLTMNKLESKMLRLLRLKNINRFRPQSQQSTSFTRLIDVNDVAKHWDYIEEGMRSLINNDEEVNVIREVTSALSDTDVKASTSDKIEMNSKVIEQETSIEVNKSEKRPLERELEQQQQQNEEDISALERIGKRVRFSEEDTKEKSELIQFPPTKAISDVYNDWDDDDDDDKLENRRNATPSIKIVRRKNDNVDMKNKFSVRTPQISSKSSISLRKPAVTPKKKIRLIRKRQTPRVRSNKLSTATWVQKYNIEECCIRLNSYDLVYENGME